MVRRDRAHGVPVARPRPLRDCIEGLRRERGWSQEALAHKAGIPLRSLAGYLSRTRPVTPGIDALIRLADAFQVPLDVVVGRTWPPATPPDPTQGATEIIQAMRHLQHLLTQHEELGGR